MGERVDKKHRFTIRIDKGLFRECEALTLRHDVSMNLLLNEMILFAKSSKVFNDFLNRHYMPDDRHGHFVYIRGDGR